MKYEIEKEEKNIEVDSKDQDGNIVKVEGNRYTVKIEGIEQRLMIVTVGLGDTPKAEIEKTIEEALKNRPK